MIEQATTPSQSLNPAYGLGFWTNAQDAWSPGEPAELVGLAGWQSNVCRILPSLDLVVARTATGPLHWDDGGFQRRLAEALA